MAYQNTKDSCNDVPIYELMDEKKRDSQREPDYSQLSTATINRESVYATSSTAVHHAEGGERKTGHGIHERSQDKGKIFIGLLITIAVVAIILLICIAILFVKVAKLEQTATPKQSSLNGSALNYSSILLQLQQLNTTLTSIVQQSPLNRPALNNSNTLFQLQQLNMTLHSSIELLYATLENNTRQLNQILESGLNESSNETQIVRTELSQGITSIADFLIQQSTVSPCAAVLNIFPSSPSGYYWVRVSNGSAVGVYCDMTLSCGNITGGWMRVAEQDFNNTSIMCPSSLSPLQEMNTRTCRIASSGAGCASVLFSTSSVTYNQVCGKVLAYQVNSPDAFRNFNDSSIDGGYVDGVSLTHGTGPRQHIWTFAAALHELGGSNACECSNRTNGGTPPPEFVGQDYFCDSGLARFNNQQFPGLVTTSPLWDGAGCGPDSTCCTFNNPPWFHKQLPSPTSDDIEMRVCRDQNRFDEDIGISSVQIYIRS